MLTENTRIRIVNMDEVVFLRDRTIIFVSGALGLVSQFALRWDDCPMLASNIEADFPADCVRWVFFGRRYVDVPDSQGSFVPHFVSDAKRIDEGAVYCLPHGGDWNVARDRKTLYRGNDVVRFFDENGNCRFQIAVKNMHAESENMRFQYKSVFCNRFHILHVASNHQVVPRYIDVPTGASAGFHVDESSPIIGRSDMKRKRDRIYRNDVKQRNHSTWAKCASTNDAIEDALSRHVTPHRAKKSELNAVWRKIASRLSYSTMDADPPAWLAQAGLNVSDINPKVDIGKRESLGLLHAAMVSFQNYMFVETVVKGGSKKRVFTDRTRKSKLLYEDPAKISGLIKKLFLAYIAFIQKEGGPVSVSVNEAFLTNIRTNGLHLNFSNTDRIRPTSLTPSQDVTGRVPVKNVVFSQWENIKRDYAKTERIELVKWMIVPIFKLFESLLSTIEFGETEPDVFRIWYIFFSTTQNICAKTSTASLCFGTFLNSDISIKILEDFGTKIRR